MGSRNGRSVPGNWLTIVLAAIWISGCHSPPPPLDPLTTTEIIALAGDHKAPEEIIAAIDHSRTVYILRARDVKDLLEKGVDDRVVDHMLETRIRDVERRYRYLSYPYYSPYWGPHAYFGYHYHHGW